MKKIEYPLLEEFLSLRPEKYSDQSVSEFYATYHCGITTKKFNDTHSSYTRLTKLLKTEYCNDRMSNNPNFMSQVHSSYHNPIHINYTYSWGYVNPRIREIEFKNDDRIQVYITKPKKSLCRFSACCHRA